MKYKHFTAHPKNADEVTLNMRIFINELAEDLDLTDPQIDHAAVELLKAKYTAEGLAWLHDHRKGSNRSPFPQFLSDCFARVKEESLDLYAQV